MLHQQQTHASTSVGLPSGGVLQASAAASTWNSAMVAASAAASGNSAVDLAPRSAWAAHRPTVLGELATSGSGGSSLVAQGIHPQIAECPGCVAKHGLPHRCGLEDESATSVSHMQYTTHSDLVVSRQSTAATPGGAGMYHPFAVSPYQRSAPTPTSEHPSSHPSSALTYMVGPHDHHHQLQQQQQQQAARCSCGDPSCNQFVLVNVAADSMRPLVRHHGLVPATAMAAQPIFYAGPTAPYGQAPSGPVAYHAVVDDSAVGFYHQHVQQLVPAAGMHHGQVVPLMAAGPQYLAASGHTGPMWSAPANAQGYADQPRSQPVWASRSAGAEVPHRLSSPSHPVDTRSVMHKPEVVGVFRSESAADLANETRDVGGWRVPQLETSEKDLGGNRIQAAAALDDDDSRPTKDVGSDVAKTSFDNVAGYARQSGDMSLQIFKNVGQQKYSGTGADVRISTDNFSDGGYTSTRRNSSDKTAADSAVMTTATVDANRVVPEKDLGPSANVSGRNVGNDDVVVGGGNSSFAGYRNSALHGSMTSMTFVVDFDDGGSGLTGGTGSRESEKAAKKLEWLRRRAAQRSRSTERDQNRSPDTTVNESQSRSRGLEDSSPLMRRRARDVGRGPNSATVAGAGRPVIASSVTSTRSPQMLRRGGSFKSRASPAQFSSDEDDSNNANVVGSEKRRSSLVTQPRGRAVADRPPSGPTASRNAARQPSDRSSWASGGEGLGYHNIQDSQQLQLTSNASVTAQNFFNRSRNNNSDVGVDANISPANSRRQMKNRQLASADLVEQMLFSNNPISASGAEDIEEPSHLAGDLRKTRKTRARNVKRDTGSDADDDNEVRLSASRKVNRKPAEGDDDDDDDDDDVKSNASSGGTFVIDSADEREKEGTLSDNELSATAAGRERDDQPVTDEGHVSERTSQRPEVEHFRDSADFKRENVDDTDLEISAVTTEQKKLRTYPTPAATSISSSLPEKKTGEAPSVDPSETKPSETATNVNRRLSTDKWSELIFGKAAAIAASTAADSLENDFQLNISEDESEIVHSDLPPPSNDTPALEKSAVLAGKRQLEAVPTEELEPAPAVNDECTELPIVETDSVSAMDSLAFKTAAHKLNEDCAVLAVAENQPPGGHLVDLYRSEDVAHTVLTSSTLSSPLTKVSTSKMETAASPQPELHDESTVVVKPFTSLTTTFKTTADDHSASQASNSDDVVLFIHESDDDDDRPKRTRMVERKIPSRIGESARNESPIAVAVSPFGSSKRQLPNIPPQQEDQPLLRKSGSPKLISDSVDSGSFVAVDFVAPTPRVRRKDAPSPMQSTSTPEVTGSSDFKARMQQMVNSTLTPIEATKPPLPSASGSFDESEFSTTSSGARVRRAFVVQSTDQLLSNTADRFVPISATLSESSVRRKQPSPTTASSTAKSRKSRGSADLTHQTSSDSDGRSSKTGNRSMPRPQPALVSPTKDIRFFGANGSSSSSSSAKTSKATTDSGNIRRGAASPVKTTTTNRRSAPEGSLAGGNRLSGGLNDSVNHRAKRESNVSASDEHVGSAGARRDGSAQQRTRTAGSTNASTSSRSSTAVRTQKSGSGTGVMQSTASSRTRSATRSTEQPASRQTRVGASGFPRKATTPNVKDAAFGGTSSRLQQERGRNLSRQADSAMGSNFRRSNSAMVLPVARRGASQSPVRVMTVAEQERLQSARDAFKKRMAYDPSRQAAIARAQNLRKRAEAGSRGAYTSGSSEDDLHSNRSSVNSEDDLLRSSIGRFGGGVQRTLGGSAVAMYSSSMASNLEALSRGEQQNGADGEPMSSAYDRILLRSILQLSQNVNQYAGKLQQQHRSGTDSGMSSTEIQSARGDASGLARTSSACTSKLEEILHNLASAERRLQSCSKSRHSTRRLSNRSDEE